MDHSYGVMQDSGIGSPSEGLYRRSDFHKPHIVVKEESQDSQDSIKSHMVLPDDLDHTEEVETSDSPNYQIISHKNTVFIARHMMLDHHEQMSSPTGFNQSENGRCSSRADIQHDSGVADVSSFTPNCSTTSSSVRSSCHSHRGHLASPMDVFVPNATSTPEDGAVAMDTQSPGHAASHNKISELHRSLLFSGLRQHSPDSHMSVSPDEAVVTDRRPVTPTSDVSNDMSHMAVPADGYFSRENLRINQIGRVSRNLHMKQIRRRMNVHNIESTPPAQANPYSYFPQRERTPSPNIAPIPRLNLNEPVTHESASPSTTPESRVNILKAEPQHIGTPDGEKMIIQIPALKPRSHGPPRGQMTDVRRQLSGSMYPSSRTQRHNGPSSAFSSLAQLQAAQRESHCQSQVKIKQEVDGSTSWPHTANGFDPGPEDDSLTNIHWLKNMSSAGFVPNTSPLVPVNHDTGQSTMTITNTPIFINGNHIIIQQQQQPETQVQDVSVVDSEKHIKKIAEECGRTQRPPYAYMHLIQMAIKSYPEQKATLKQIYTWIEETFPYYKYTDKKGWKNSIRHNLSLYNIFVRKRSGTPGATGCSYWTLQPGVKPMPKSRTANSSLTEERIHVPISVHKPIAPAQSTFQASDNSAFTRITNSQKKGPAPLLPKPAAVQSYTIIPLPAEASLSPSVLGSHAIVVTSDQVSVATSDGSLDTETIQAVNSLISSCSTSSEQTASSKVSSLKRSTSCEVEGPRKKHVKTGPVPSILSRRRSSSRTNSTFLGSSLDTSDLMQQMSQMKFETSANDSKIENHSQDSLDGFEQAPAPRTRKPRKEKIRYRVDSTEKKADEDAVMTSHSVATNKPEGTCISHMNAEQLQKARMIEDNLTSPLRGLLMTPPKELTVKTSTPSKESPNTPGSWISPIHGLTPFSEEQGTLLDMTSLLDVTPNGKLSPGLEKHSPGSNNSSPGLGSLRDFGLPGLTPLKLGHTHNEPCSPFGDHSPNSSFNLSNLNQSFARFLGDIHIDGVMGDDLANGVIFSDLH